MNQINKQSVNLQEEKLKELQKLMPQLFDEEGKLDTKELELLSKDYPSSITGKYEFNWAGKMSAKRNAYKPSRANLKPDKARSIDFDSTENLIIEGDNLEVLKLLQKSYSNKIKCIYIDPPYNTGNDFIYSDDFSEDKKAYWENNGTTEKGVKVDTNTESQGRYHSNWLNMMYPRLALARELLKEDGIIFVSIDYHENYNLRKMLNEIFGEENFVGEIFWESKTKSQNTVTAYNKLQPKGEYILVYVKNSPARFNLISIGEKSYPEKDEKGVYRLAMVEQMNSDGVRGRDSMIFEIEGIQPKNGYQWQIGIETVEEFKQREDLLVINGQPFRKLRPSDERTDINEPFWGFFSKEIGTTESAKKELNELVQGHGFETVKPVELLKKMVFHSTKDGDTVLDFFAGSGTTADAVMNLNSEEHSNRKYILVQIPEVIDKQNDLFKTISDICIERAKRVSEKIKKEDKEKLLKDGKNLDLGFKVFKLSPSFFPENQFTPDPEKTEEENMHALNEYLEKAKSQMKFEFDEEELLFEILLKDGFKLNFTKELIGEIKENKVYKVMDGDKEALLCLDDSIENSTLKILEGMKDMRFICLERAVDTTKKWNLKSIFGQNLWVA